MIKSQNNGMLVEIVPSYIEPKKELQTVRENVEFDLDKSFIPDTSMARLRKLVAKVKAMKLAQIELYGHADTIGNAEYNKSLSVRRSKAVAEMLTSLGFPSDKIHFNAYGSAVPKTSNTNETGRARNRRVEILVKEE
jgi:OOP family OmpA-OmpF porin